jgi:hypothetical protein
VVQVDLVEKVEHQEAAVQVEQAVVLEVVEVAD